MNFLHISEPNNSAKRPIGIDLGTTNSLVASALPNGEIELLPISEGQHTQNLPHAQAMLPSIVAYGLDDKIYIGEKAHSVMNIPQWQVFSSIKRYMGLSCKEIQNCPYVFTRDSIIPKFIIPNGTQTAQQIASQILLYLYKKIQNTIGGISSLVITVPAYFNDAQRQATKDAARLAGLPEPRLLNEPTAAALAYGIQNQADSYVAVYDLGGGTFDISILKCTNQFLQVLVSSGDTQLGGDDFDTSLLRLVMEKNSIALPSDISPHEMQVVMANMRALKEQLSESHLAEAYIQAFAHSGFDGYCRIDRSAFALATHDLVEKTRMLTVQALQDACVTADQLSHIVLVGGSTRMPHVRNMLCKQFPHTHIHDSVNPDTTVAIGAALYASVLAGEQKGRTLVDVTPLSLGIETLGGLVEKIIPRNTSIPVQRKQVFTTAQDGQSAFLMHLVQGERELVRDCRSLARFTLDGIPPMAAGQAKLEVTFSIDPSGLLHVEACERTSGVSQHITSEPSSGLRQEEITAMIASSYQHAQSDIKARQLQEAVQEGERLLEATNKALELDEDLLQIQEKKDILQSIARLKTALTHTNYQDITKANAQLVETTNNFAQNRMNKTLKKSLHNKNINDIKYN